MWLQEATLSRRCAGLAVRTLVLTAPPTTRAPNYNSFWQLAVDQANARIYGGIHFRFDNTAQTACPKVAEFAHEYNMRPRD